MSDNSNPDSFDVLAAAPTSALAEITRGEIDIQISTAHKFPRSMAKFKTRAIDMVTIDEETAESCIYVRPVGMKNGQMQYAEGLSIRMAEIVAACYGNIRSGCMIVEQTDRKVVCRGFCHDLETNNAVASECVEPTVKSNGQPFSEGMRNVVAKACLKKALRDAIFSVVPKALCRPIEAKARELLSGQGKSMEMRRTAVMQWLNKLGIDVARVFNSLGVTGEADLTSEHLVRLTGLKTAIKDGEVKIEDAFPPIGGGDETPPKPTVAVSGTPQQTAPPATPVPATTQPKPEAQAEPEKPKPAAVADQLPGQDPEQLRLAAVSRVTALMGEAGISMGHFKARCLELGITESSTMLSKMSLEQLENVEARWRGGFVNVAPPPTGEEQSA